MLRNSKKIKLAIIMVTLLIICTVIGILKYREYTYSARNIDASVAVDMDNIKVHCVGKGEPTVIFEPGFGCTMEEWRAVQPEISKITRTFSYNRIDDLKNGRTILNQVHELHSLLAVTKVEGPYIIVAHSLGGLNARVFAATYPNEVTGIIFIDSSNENQFENPLFRNGISPQEINIIDTDANQVKEIREKDVLRNIPIIVLTSDHWIEQTSDFPIEDWMNYQNDIASLSNRSKHIVVNKSSHFIQNDNPDVVIDAIKEIIKEVKK